MEKVRFIERRLIFVDDLKNLCEDKKLYTMGDEECLAKMLNKCKKPRISIFTATFLTAWSLQTYALK